MTWFDLRSRASWLMLSHLIQGVCWWFVFPQNTRERWGKEPDECEEEELQEILVNNKTFSLCFWNLPDGAWFCEVAPSYRLNRMWPFVILLCFTTLLLAHLVLIRLFILHLRWFTLRSTQCCNKMTTKFTWVCSSLSTVRGPSQLEESWDFRVSFLWLWTQWAGPGEMWHQDVLWTESGGQVSYSQRGWWLVGC